MRLLASTDYALRLLMLLAQRRDETTSVETLARTLDLSRNHLHKIVQELHALGVVETMRGVGGGVRLAKPAGNCASAPSFARSRPTRRWSSVFGPTTAPARSTPDAAFARC